MVNKAGLRTVPIASVLAAIALVVPLFVLALWGGLRIAQSDDVLSVIAASEQPLSVRSPNGVWAVLLALAWFGVGYWRRRITLWEAALVVVGGSLALARLGNAWVYGLAMIAPLARQLAPLRLKGPSLAAVVAVGLAVGAYTFLLIRPPALPDVAARAALNADHRVVFADWRWAPELQQAVGASGQVLAAGGLASESPAFWVDYVRITQGHERWAEALNRMGVGVVVLEGGQARAAQDLVRGSADWHVVYDADGVVVAERATS